MMPTTQELLQSPGPTDWDDPDRPVSSLSRWRDGVWHLDSPDPALPAIGVGVHWWSERSDAIPPTERQKGLLEQLKRVAWLGFVDPTGAAFCRKPKSMAQFASHARALTRFMEDMQLDDLSKLDPATVERYKEWTLEDVRGSVGTEAEETIRRRIGARLAVVANVWSVAPRLARTGVPVPSADPLAGGRPGAIGSRLADKAFEGLPALPPEVQLAVLNAAASVVLVHSADVLLAQDTWLRATGGFGSSADRRIGQTALSSLVFRTTGLSDTFWPGRIGDRSVAWQHEVPSMGLRTLVSAVRDACTLVLLGTAGLRISEVAAIPGGRSDPNGLPDCLKTEVSEDGLVEVFKVTSKLTKRQIVPLETSWVVGCRPVGTSSLPLAVAAIDLLERLMSPWRAISSDGQARVSLALAFNNRSMPTMAKEVRRLTVPLMRRSIRRFYSRFVPFEKLPDRSVGLNGDDLGPYRRLRGSNIHMSQYRKSYSQFLLRMDSGLLPAIQAQFKHLRIATTQRYYTGNDPRTLGGPDDEQRLAGNRAIAAILGQDHRVAGRLAEIVDRFRADAHDVADDAEELTTDSDAARLGLSLLPAEHGWCGILFAPHRSRCNQMAGTASVLNLRPDETFRNPTTCGGCPVFAVDAQFAAYWRRRFETNRRIWEGRPTGCDADYRVALTRMRQAAAVLRRLGEET